MIKKNRLLILGISLFGALLIFWMINPGETSTIQEPASSAQEDTIAVEVTQASVATVANYLSYTGTVAGTKDGNLSFRLQGMLESIHTEEGEKVQKGRLLAVISIPELDAQLRRAVSELKKAESSRDFWEKEASTDSTLYQEGAIAKTVFNKTTFNYEQALSSYNSAIATLEEVRERKNLTRLQAPADGTIGSVLVRQGSNIMPNQPVFFFHQGEPTIHADVIEQDIQKGIKTGSRVIAELNSEKTTVGTVTRIDSQAKPPFRSVRVFTSFPENSLNGRPSGAGVSLKFEVNRQDNALLVPVSSLDLRGETPRLFKVNDQMNAEAVFVEPGIQQGEYRQVKGDISTTDKIISSGANSVEDGDPVEIVREIKPNI